MTDKAPVVVTDDIFMKASVEYCRRLGKDPFQCNNNWGTYADDYRNALEDLAERINSLKSVGAI